MNNIIKKSIYVSMLGLFALFTSCEERQEELTELMTDRVFSATGVEARIVKYFLYFCRRNIKSSCYTALIC